MSFVDTLIKQVTGTDPATIQAQLDVAQQQVTLAIETMIALQLVGDILLFLLVVMAFKERRA
jgi:hypothetical protein